MIWEISCISYTKYVVILCAKNQSDIHNNLSFHIATYYQCHKVYVLERKNDSKRHCCIDIMEL